jgi:hypothetical protein
LAEVLDTKEASLVSKPFIYGAGGISADISDSIKEFSVLCKVSQNLQECSIHRSSFGKLRIKRTRNHHHHHHHHHHIESSYVFCPKAEALVIYGGGFSCHI